MILRKYELMVVLLAPTQLEQLFYRRQLCRDVASRILRLMDRLDLRQEP